MTWTNGLWLVAIMVTLAALPSTSVALVVTRSATRGMPDGIAAAAGIVAGDLCFVTLAILGMSVLAQSMGAFFAIIKYAGGAYLIWTGWRLLQASNRPHPLSPSPSPSQYTLLTSFASGLLITLGDVKAIVFYASLFPLFVDMTNLKTGDVAAIIVLTTLTVGGVKVTYAVAARQIVQRLRTTRAQRCGQRLGGTLLIGAGTYMIAKN